MAASKRLSRIFLLPQTAAGFSLNILEKAVGSRVTQTFSLEV